MSDDCMLHTNMYMLIKHQEEAKILGTQLARNWNVALILAKTWSFKSGSSLPCFSATLVDV